MANLSGRDADKTKEYILTFDENGGSPAYTKIEDANGVDRTAEVVELLGINDKASLSDVSKTQHGSNANGTYLKIYEGEHTGIMICQSPVFVMDATEERGSGVYTSAVGERETWTFPQEFASTPTINVSVNLIAGWGSAGSGLTSVIIAIFHADGSREDQDVRATAIGEFDDTPE